MHVYKELSFVGNKPELDKLSEEIYNVFPTDWIKPKSNQMLKDYILADYIDGHTRTRLCPSPR